MRRPPSRTSSRVGASGAGGGQRARGRCGGCRRPREPEEGGELRAERAEPPAAHLLLGAVERLAEALVAERLEQVVERPRVERLHGRTGRRR
jgi:hypothetical protein